MDSIQRTRQDFQRATGRHFGYHGRTPIMVAQKHALWRLSDIVTYPVNGTAYTPIQDTTPGSPTFGQVKQQTGMPANAGPA